MDRLRIALATTLAALLATSAQARDPATDTPAVFATLQVSPGDPPVARTVQVFTGGPIDSHFDTDLPPDCDGDITEAPGVVLDYAGGDAALRLSARSLSRTRATVLVQSPQGQWLCDHGRYGRETPEVRIDAPGTGRYAIWVGAYESPAGEAELLIERLPGGDGSARP